MHHNIVRGGDWLRERCCSLCLELPDGAQVVMEQINVMFLLVNKIKAIGMLLIVVHHQVYNKGV